MHAKGEHIWRASLIQSKLLEDHDEYVPLDKIRLVLRNTLNMRFRQIKKIAFLGNT
jgi:hypothetical protein